MTKNILLRAMPAEDYALLRPHLEAVVLRKGDVLVEANVPIAQVYFLESGVTSVVAISPEGQRIEAGIFGRDGCSGVPIILGTDRTPNTTFIQIEGAGFRMPADAFRDVLAQSASLMQLFLRFAQAMSVQAAHSTLTNALHSLPERLARWLLMCHDRVDGDELALTHEFMSLMLGVRRPGVTTTLHVLEGGLLVRATRGRVTVRNRAGLEEFAADAYGVPEAEYARLIAPFSKSASPGA